MIILNETEFRKIKRFEDDTLTDYGIRNFTDAGLKGNYYIEENNLMVLVEDLLVHYNRAIEELEDLKEEINQNYISKEMSDE